MRPQWAHVALRRWLILAVLLALPLPALAETYESDPLALIAHMERVNVNSMGVDAWEVWVCDTRNGIVPVDAEDVASSLRSQMPAYFSTMSGGVYQPAFVVGGRVEVASDSTWPDEPRRRQIACEAEVQSHSSGSARGALVVIDVEYAGGYATAGFICPPGETCPTTFPSNGRIAVVGALAVWGPEAEPRTVAHELGHAISFPHSYGGLNTLGDGQLNEYDNPMDVMSGGNSGRLDIGTIAINRYAAAWIGVGAVAFHRGGSLTYEISASTGTQMLVLPRDDGPGVYETLSVRVGSGIDTGIPKEGIEVYRIDQRGQACGLGSDASCWGLERRTQQLPAIDSTAGSAHVFGVGEAFTIRGLQVEVIGRTGDTITVRVTGKSVSQRFVDDDGNAHESNIEAIAAIGLTRGCNPPLVDRYCPSRSVSRAEMAVFLIRMLEGSVPQAAHIGIFSDLTAGTWYSAAVERLHQLGIVKGFEDGTYRPATIVSRAEMAAMLARALGLPQETATGFFGDVDAAAWYAQSVESLQRAGITGGCSVQPVSYCPSAPVLRDQMATFLARAIGVGA